MANYAGNNTDMQSLNKVTPLIDLKNGRVLINVPENASDCEAQTGDYPTTSPWPEPAFNNETRTCMQDNCAPCEKDSTTQDFASYESLRNIQVRTQLSDIMFSPQNIQYLTDKIRHEVYKRTGRVISSTPEFQRELRIILRAFFLQHSSFQSDTQEQIRHEVAYVDSLTVEYSVAKIIGNIQQYETYVYDVENLPVPIELPQNLSSKGARTLKSVFTTF